MKKALSFFLTIALFCSCTKMKMTDLAEPHKPDGLNKNDMIKSAGDGTFDVLGFGYDVTGDYAASTSTRFPVIDIAKLGKDHPDRVIEDLSQYQFFNLTIGTNALNYTKSLTASIGISIGIPLFSGTLKSTYFDSTSYQSKYLYSSYDHIIQRRALKFSADISLLRNYLSPSFAADLQSSSAQTIVERYGTHVLTNIIMGGKLRVFYRSETSNLDRFKAASAGIDMPLKNIFGFNANIATNSSEASRNTSQTIHYRSWGGDPSISLFGQIPLDNNNPPPVNTAAWQASITIQNAQMIALGNNSLIPIYDLIADPVKQASVKSYAEQYMRERQITLTASLIPHYRCYNSLNNDRLITNNPGEIRAWPGWRVEMLFGRFFTDNSIEGVVPLYRFILRDGTHLYSTNQFEVIDAVFEGIHGYVSTTQLPGTIPLYRYTSDKYAAHMYSLDYGELGGGRDGWRYEGIMGYVYPG